MIAPAMLRATLAAETLAETAPAFKTGVHLTRIGELLRAEGEQLLRQRNLSQLADKATAETSAKLSELGLPESVIKTHSGLQIGLFPNNNVVLRRNFGDVSLMKFSPIQSYSEPRLLFYDQTAKGRSFIESLQVLREEAGNFHLSTPGAKGNILKLKGADDSFLDKFITGTKPVGIGNDRLALLTQSNDIALIGPKCFRQGVPDLLHPKKRIANELLQVEFLERADTLRTSPADVGAIGTSMQRSGWEFRDPHLAQVGRLSDGTLKLLDAGCPVAKPLETVDHKTAANAYASAIQEAGLRYGKESHAVGALQSRMGMHEMKLESMMSAEQNLQSGLAKLTAHQDWSGAADVATNLAELYSKVKPGRVIEFQSLHESMINLAREH